MSGWDPRNDQRPIGDPWAWLGIAVIVIVVLLAMASAIDMDDTRTNLPPEPAVYQHPEGP